MFSLTDVTIDGLLVFTSNTATAFPVTIKARNHISNSTLNAMVYIQKPVSNLRTAPTTTTKFTDIGKINYFIDDGTNVTVTIHSVDMPEPMVCQENILNGTCYIEANTHYTRAGEYCFNITAFNFASSSTIVHCHTIQHEIQDFQVNTSAPIFIPPSTFTLTMDALLASHCNLTLIIGGDIVADKYVALMNRTNGDVFSIAHEYAIPGSYLVQLHMTNDVSNASFEVMIHSQYPVDPMEITTTQTSFELLQDAIANLTFNLAYTGNLQPTAVTVNYTVTGVTKFNHVQNIFDNATYPFQEIIHISDYGTYTIEWHAFNMLSSKNKTITVEIDRPIQDLNFVPSIGPYGIINESVPFDISISWGSRVTYTVTYGDGKEDVIFKNEDGHAITHVWDVNAFYTVKVTAANSIGIVEYTIPDKIEIVIPIKGIRLSARKLNLMPAEDPRQGEVPIHVFVERDVDIALDATVSVDFGDGTPNFNQSITDFLMQINENSPLDTPDEKLGRSLTYFYSQPGVFTIRLHFWNVATKATERFEVFVFEEITDITQTVKYTTALLPPLGAPNSTFDVNHYSEFGLISVPLDKATILTVSYATGTGLSYSWDFGDGPNSMMVTTEPRAAYWYQKPAEYLVTVNVSNPVDWQLHTAIRVDVEVPVTSVQLRGNGPGPANSTFDFEILPGNIGTGVCYRIDFIDEESLINRIAILGDRYACERQYPDDFADAFIRFTEVNTKQLYEDQKAGKDITISVSNHFMTIGSYHISITASNMVSSRKSNYLQIVLKPDCFPPELYVDENNRCDSHIPCKDGYRQFMASETVIVYSKIKNKCKTSKSVWFSWNVYKVGAFPTDPEVLYNSKLNNTKLEGASVRDLSIRGPVFDYGTYRFELNVSMVEEVGIFNLAETYIHITKSPLVVQVSGGYFRSSSWNSYDFIDGISNTYDPDKRGTASKEGLKFTWFCRRVTYHDRRENGTVVIQNVESFETWNADYTEKIANGTVNPAFIPRDGDKLGCFGLAKSDEIPLPGGTYTLTRIHNVLKQ